MFWFYLCLGMVILAALLLTAGVYIWVYQDAKERGTLIDATYGRKTASVLIMDSDHVVLSALAAERLAPRLGMTVADMTEEE